MTYYKAKVTEVHSTGQHGPYAVAVSDDLKGSVTFSLKRPIWKAKKWPNPGDIVLLSDVRERAQGWRAMAGRFSRPETRK